MREGVIDRAVKDLRRFRVVGFRSHFEIMDTKSQTPYGGYDRVRYANGNLRIFRNFGRAQKIADKLEAEAAQVNELEG